MKRRSKDMKSGSLLLVPRANIPASYGFGTIFLILSILGLSSSFRLVFRSGHSWDVFGTIFVILLLISLRLIFLHRILQFQKEGQSLAIYWGVGFPFKGCFIKLPWIWRHYSGNQIMALRVARGWRIDGSPDAEGYRVYKINAKIARKWIDLAEYMKLERSLYVSRAIAEFLGLPLDESGL